MGADRAFLVKAGGNVEHWGRKFSSHADEENRAVDSRQAGDRRRLKQTGQMRRIARMAAGDLCLQLEVDGSDFKVTREVDGGLQTTN